MSGLTDDPKNPQNVAQAPKPERQIRIPWRGGVPDVSDLTGADAKRVLHNVLVEGRALQRKLAEVDALRQTLSSILVAMVHRDNVRGILGADGQPVVPMVSTIPRASADVGLEVWRFQTMQGPDGSVSIVVDRGPERPALVALPGERVEEKT